MNRKMIVPIVGSILLGLVLWGFKISGDRIEEAQSKAASIQYGLDKEKNQFLQKQQALTPGPTK